MNLLRPYFEWHLLLELAIDVVIKNGKGQIQALQVECGVDYTEAMKIMAKLEQLGVVGPSPGGGKPHKLIAAKCERCNESFVPYPLKPSTVCSECYDEIHPREDVSVGCGDFVPMIWMIEELRRRKDGCTMNELIATVMKNFSGIEQIKKREL